MEPDKSLRACVSPGSTSHFPVRSLQRTDGGADPGAGDRSLCREALDDRCVFFLGDLPTGRGEIRYTMRAVFTGDFRALPLTAEAMYVPVIAAHSIATRRRAGMRWLTALRWRIHGRSCATPSVPM
jgi:hypothetical protein